MCTVHGLSDVTVFSPYQQHASSDVERLLIGNKCDWETKRAISTEKGRALAASQGVPFLETSAKTNHKIDEVMLHDVS